MTTLRASQPTTPATSISTTLSSVSSRLNSLIPSTLVVESAVLESGHTDAQCLSVPVPSTSGSSTVTGSDPDPGIPVEGTALLGTSAGIDVTDAPFLSSVPLTQKVPLEVVASKAL